MTVTPFIHPRFEGAFPELFDGEFASSFVLEPRRLAEFSANGAAHDAEKALARLGELLDGTVKFVEKSESASFDAGRAEFDVARLFASDAPVREGAAGAVENDARSETIEEAPALFGPAIDLSEGLAELVDFGEAQAPGEPPIEAAIALLNADARDPLEAAGVTAPPQTPADDMNAGAAQGPAQPVGLIDGAAELALFGAFTTEMDDQGLVVLPADFV